MSDDPGLFEATPRGWGVGDRVVVQLIHGDIKAVVVDLGRDRLDNPIATVLTGDGDHIDVGVERLRPITEEDQ